MQRKDKKGRNLRTGEYYDEENNRYMFRKMINGKRYTISENDLTELRKQEVNLMASIENGSIENQRLEKMTLDQYFEAWYENSGKSSRKATSVMNCKSYYQAHVKGTELGSMEIRKIRKIHCQKLFNEMIAAGKKRSTLNNMKDCLMAIFSEAEDDDVIIKNPCRNIRFHNVEAGKREPIASEQVRLFMDFIRNDGEFSIHYNFFVAFFNLGMRIGEICGLTWDCVDIEHSTVTIKKSLNRYREKDYGFTNAIGSTKSRNSVRTILCNDLVMAAFERQRDYQEMSGIIIQAIPIVDDYGRVLGSIDNLVFTQTSGRAWNEPAIVRLIHRIVEKQNRLVAGTDNLALQYFTPHQVRHTYTTLAYEAGADMTAVSFRLGHASEQITQSTYTHLRGKKKDEQDIIINKVRIK